MKSQKWKTLAIDTSNIPAGDLDFLGGLEELDDYEILRPGDEAKAAKRKAEKSKKPKRKKLKVSTDELTSAFDGIKEIDISAWSSYGIHESILKGLKEQGFQKPTEIQELTIPVALRGNQDILGAAETGSGKTLAFGIPIVNSIIHIKESKQQSAKEDAESEKPLYSIILTPTRELAIQIKNHLLAICKYADLRIAVVVGGMAPEKQQRILKRRPEIVVATPGRLWELIEGGESHLSHVSNVRHLVIDEADRMMEKGHFAQLTEILNLIKGNSENRRRQTFVFSATLTLVHDMPTRLKGKKNKTQQKQKLESLTNLIGMKDPKVIDITKTTAVVESLTETQIMSSNEDKDSYLYYFLLMHPGRTLVFCNSIDCVRRLRTVLEFLNCHPLPLHASMPQRQRLKNLDRFASSNTAVLLATDVAARGLDIKGIEHVIHFQVPRTAETYVHRSGRTARAQKEGLSLLLIEPQDGSFYKRICKTLNKDQSLPTFPVDHKIFKIVKERVTLVRSIDKIEHRMKRLTAENRWFQKTAEEMDVDIEEENLLNDLGDQHEYSTKCRQINAMKKQLKGMLAKSITSRMFSGGYPTKSGKLVNPSIYDPQKAVKVVKKKHKKV